MRLASVSSALLCLILTAHPATGTYHPCAAYSAHVSKLDACSTALPFCSQYLGGQGMFTTTVYVTKTARQPYAVDSTRVTDVQTVESTDVVATYTSTVTATSTTLVPCQDMRRKEKRKATGSSCGISRGTKPSVISGACNCILKSTTTKTVTETPSTRVIEVTATFFSTTYISSTMDATATTTSTATITETGCIPTETFNLQIVEPSNRFDGRYIGEIDKVYTQTYHELVFVEPPSAPSNFTLDDQGFLTNVDLGLVVETEPGINPGNTAYCESQFECEAAIFCSVNQDTSMLQCNSPAGTTFNTDRERHYRDDVGWVIADQPSNPGNVFTEISLAVVYTD